MKSKKNIPYHLGIIMDGNRRWARERGLPTLVGHRRGYEKVIKVGDWCLKRGVKILTLFAFSTENWHRSKEEVSYLMKLLKRSLNKKNIRRFNQKGIKVQVIGQKERLDKSFQRIIAQAEEKTKNNKKGILNLAISYGGRAEIVEAIKKIIKENIPLKKINEETISQHLWTAGLPDPDLIIRTSGELRISGFLIWQSAYSELYFIKKYWPDFTEEDLEAAFTDYSQRQRRFGQ
ncbi:MAG: polyprenyl diphosphate synthase [Minisyncoccales bacterium]